MSKPLNLLLISFAALASFAPIASAQDSGYAPPPMFDDMTPPMVRPETNNGYIVEPKASPKTPLPPEAPAAKPVILPRVSVNPDSKPVPATSPVPGAVTMTTKTAPVPQQPAIPPAAPAQPKKMQPIIDARDVQKPAVSKPVVSKPVVSKPVVSKPVVKTPETTVPKPPVKPAVKAPEVKTPVTKIDTPSVPATPVAPQPKPVVKELPPEAKQPPQPSPIAPEPETETIKPEPAKRDPKESAIKGPKTMPALPTEEIAKQKTFESKTGAVEKETMLERRQKQVAEEKKKEEEATKPVAVAPKPNVAPAAFDKNAQGALKKTIPFAQGQIGLSSAEIDPIAVAVNKELDADGKDAWRVQIRAYATPYGTGVSSDRRIALSRALSLRTALIAQGVPAARIDVLAEGLQSENQKQPDRIDLYMYGPETN